MLKILLITNQTSLPGEKGFTRALSLYELLKARGEDPFLVTSSFNHYDKTQRNVTIFQKENPSLHIAFISEPGYRKNVCLMRIVSQLVFARRLSHWFKKNFCNFDVVYSTMPTNEGTLLVGQFCNKRHIPFLIDIQDLWPEAMFLILKNRFVFSFLTWPMKIIANNAYKTADSFTAVSLAYLTRGLSVNKVAQNNSVIYLGVDLDRFDAGQIKNRLLFEKPENEFWVAYIGTLGESYDLETFISAIDILHKKGFIDIRGKILGRGPKEQSFRNYADKIHCEIDFLGFFEYEKMAGFLSCCDLMVNCIKKNAAQSVINKVGDYFASGKPVLNSCQNGEMRGLINDYDVGVNYDAGDSEGLADAVAALYSDKENRIKKGANARKLAESLFNRKTSYKKLIDQIVNCRPAKH